MGEEKKSQYKLSTNKILYILKMIKIGRTQNNIQILRMNKFIAFPNPNKKNLLSPASITNSKNFKSIMFIQTSAI